MGSLIAFISFYFSIFALLSSSSYNAAINLLKTAVESDKSSLTILYEKMSFLDNNYSISSGAFFNLVTKLASDSVFLATSLFLSSSTLGGNTLTKLESGNTF